MLLPSGNPFKCHGEVLYLQPMIPPKRFDIFPPEDWGMLRRARCRWICRWIGNYGRFARVLHSHEHNSRCSHEKVVLRQTSIISSSSSSSPSRYYGGAMLLSRLRPPRLYSLQAQRRVLSAFASPAAETVNP